MKKQQLLRILAIVATVAAALTMARVAEAVGKKALLRTAKDLSAELTLVKHEHEEVLGERDRLEMDRRLLSHRIAALSKRDHYLVITRWRNRLELALGDKEMLETTYRLRGPDDGVRAFRSMPKATLEILGKRTQTDWIRPDWVYRLEGIEPPADSADRLVENAFGPGELFLGGGIAIHGPVDDAVLPEAIDHTYLELNAKSLIALVGALEPGALVFIQ